MKSKVTIGDKSSGPSFPVVGIGASAGGLDALHRFLAGLPADFGFALVFIQHLSPKHKSLLPELLSARRPSLAIQEISDGLKAQPGRLYLSPPGKEVRLRQGVFQTIVHPEGLIHLPIDEFLVSLAEEAAERSIAVIFSGAGTDGARGCRAVRSAGGTVFVQDPQTAEFNSMPLAVLATGQADAVLSPEDIAAEILKLQGTGVAAVDLEYPISPEEYESFFRLLQEKTGSRFNHFKKSVVNRRIKRRMYLHGLSEVKDYLDLISSSDTDAAHLASDLMIGVTSFFRDRVAWKALTLEAVRKITSENTDLPIRVWTPASATGEEAYSIAMMLLTELALTGKKRDIHVFATDVNDRALERAREGKYPSIITADVPQEYVRKYFTSTEDGNFLVINKDVRERVVFARQDLLTDPPFSKLDLIICRNFLIYLEPEAQEKSITLFHYALKEGGFLFLGNAETVGRKRTLFKSIGHRQCRIYQKLETKPASRLPISVPYAAERQAPPAKQAQMTEQSRSAMEIIQEKLLEEYGPASVAIDQNYEIIYHNGPTNRYLFQPRGVPTQNLLELLPESLRSRIRGAIYRSGREDRPVAIRTSVAGDDNRKRQVSLRITKAAEDLHIVVFHEKNAASKEEAAEQVDAAVIEETAIHQLESELSATRADLQSHIEQLKSLNEELQSSNEEMQAANEELETSREELQSLNEELITVNSQLQGKIEEQDTTNNDLNNFLASTNIPTIFLDTHFRLKRFTPAMLKLIKLLPSDVGRSIVDMTQENLGPGLISDAQAVLESLVPERRELELGGAWYFRTSLPYRTADNRIEGVVITYNDVSELKKSEERTRHLASFPELNPNPVIEADASGNVIFSNPATRIILEDLDMDSENVKVFLPIDLNSILSSWDKKGSLALYREITIKDSVFSESVYLNPQFDGARIYAYDITERKRAEEEIRQSRKTFVELVEGAPFGIYTVDSRFRIAQMNIGSQNGAFRNVRPVIGRDFAEAMRILWPESVAAEIIGHFRHTLDTGEPYFSRDFINPRHDAEIMEAYEWELHRMTLPDGQYGVICYYFDSTKLREAEAALRESEQKFSVMFHKAGFGAALSQLSDGVIVDVNEAWVNLFGYARDEVIGKTSLDLNIHPDAEVRARLIDMFREQGSARDLEMTLRTKSGELRVILANIDVVDMDGRKYLLNTVQDITERKRAEEALHESEMKYRELVVNANSIIIKMDREGKISFFNDYAQKFFGYSLDEALGQNVKFLLPPMESQSGRNLGKMADVILSNPDDFAENINENVLKNGERVWISWRNKAIRDERGDIVGNLAVGQDITGRRKAEEALRKSEEQFRTLADSIPNLAWWANADGYITWYNQRWYEYTGTTPEQMEGWGWQSVHDPGALPKVLEQWKASLATGEPFEMEFPLRGADGVFRDFLTRGIPLKDSAGRVVRWLGTNTDVSALKQAEETLRQRNEDLTRFNNASVGRELRMIELKKEVNELCGRTGDAPRYPLEFEKEEL